MHMARFIKYSLLITLLVLLPKSIIAKTCAHLVGTNGKIVKMDADTDTIISTYELPETGKYIQDGDTSVLEDNINNRLYVVAGRLGCRVLVYDLKTLKFIKDLGINTPEPDVTMFRTPDGKKIFIVWWNIQLEGGAWQFDIFNGQTIEKIKTLDFYFFSKEVTFSKDSKILYAIESGSEAKITVIEMQNYKILSTIDLNTIWRMDVFGKDVDDYRNGKMLIVENEKTHEDDPSKYLLSAYDIATKTLSPRVSTGQSGKGRLSSDATKVIFNEEQYIMGTSGHHIEYSKSTGRLHVYEVATGRELGVVNYNVERESQIVGIHPNGKKVYLIGVIDGDLSLLVMDIANFKVAKVLKIPNVPFMVFYNE
jgi:hypothetical protein